MAHRLRCPRSVDGIHAQRRLAQVNRDTLGDAGRHQHHLPLPIRARQHPLHRLRRPSEIDYRHLPAPERLPPHLDRDPQEIRDCNFNGVTPDKRGDTSD